MRSSLLLCPFWISGAGGEEVKEQSQPPRGHPEQAGLSPFLLYDFLWCGTDWQIVTLTSPSPGIRLQTASLSAAICPAVFQVRCSSVDTPTITAGVSGLLPISLTYPRPVSTGLCRHWRKVWLHPLSYWCKGEMLWLVYISLKQSQSSWVVLNPGGTNDAPAK